MLSRIIFSDKSLKRKLNFKVGTLLRWDLCFGLIIQLSSRNKQFDFPTGLSPGINYTIETLLMSPFINVTKKKCPPLALSLFWWICVMWCIETLTGFSTKHQRFEFHYKLNISNWEGSKGSVIFRNLNIINLVEILSVWNDKTAMYIS